MHSQANTTSSFDLRNSGYDIGPEGSVAIQEGIIQTIKCFGSLSKADLQDIKTEVEKCCTHDWENVWSNMTQLIYIDFLDAVISIFRELK